MVSWLLGLLLFGTLSGPLQPARAQAGAKPKRVPASQLGSPQKGERPKLGKRRLRGKGAKAGKARPQRRSRTIRDQSLPDELGAITRAVSKRRYRSVLSLANAGLADDPFNGHLHAARAVGCGHYGDYPCVDESHSEARGTDSLLLMRDVARADALRHQGRPGEAAALRRLLIVDNSRTNREVSLLAKLVLDLEAAGELDAAYEAAWEAVALNPDSPIVWSMVARVEAATSSVDTAESYLWLADRTGVSSTTRVIARADIHRVFGDPVYASSLFTGDDVSTVQSQGYAVARTRALLAADLHEEVLDVYATCSWCVGEEVWHPDLLATFGEALARDGQLTAARTFADRLARTYPDHPPAQDAVQAIRVHLQAPQSP